MHRAVVETALKLCIKARDVESLLTSWNSSCSEVTLYKVYSSSRCTVSPFRGEYCASSGKMIGKQILYGTMLSIRNCSRNDLNSEIFFYKTMILNKRK